LVAEGISAAAATAADTAMAGAGIGGEWLPPSLLEQREERRMGHPVQRVWKVLPRGLKPDVFLASYGTAEAMP
jgi:hypothetical protein